MPTLMNAFVVICQSDLLEIVVERAMSIALIAIYVSRRFPSLAVPAHKDYTTQEPDVPWR